MKYLKSKTCWCNWLAEPRIGADGKPVIGADGKPEITKLPHGKDRKLAKSNDFTTWLTYEKANTYWNNDRANGGGFDGVGFFFHEDPNTHLCLCGIDIDEHCGVQNPYKAEILSRFKGTYAETSPSGNGIHIILWARRDALPKKAEYNKLWVENNKKMEVECYCGGITNRYFTFTHRRISEGEEITDQTEALLDFLNTYMKRPEPKRKVQPSPAPEALINSPAPGSVSASASSVLDLTAPMAATTSGTEEKRADGRDFIMRRLAAARINPRFGNEFHKLYDIGDTSKYRPDGAPDTKGSENQADLRLCTLLEYFLDGDATAIDEAFRGAAIFRPKWDERRGSQTYGEMTISKAITEASGRHYSDERMPYSFNDSGNARKFIEIYGQKVSYTPALGWLVFDGTTWKTAENTVRNLTMKFAEEMRREAVFLEFQSRMDSPDSKASDEAQYYRKYATTLGNAEKQSAMLKQAAALVYREASEFDAQPYILNTPNGAWNLSEGKYLPAEEFASTLSTHCTKFSPVHSDQGGKMWSDFLERLFEGNEDYISYAQLYMGMCSIGEVTQEKLLLAVGDGRNGKSTFFNACALVMGDYAGTMDADILVQSPRMLSNYKSDIAGLRGRRLIVCGEIREGSTISESAVKRLCSTDMLRIEYKYKDAETIQPSHHICLFCNDLPRIPSSQLALKRRLEALEFGAHFDEDEAILNYANVLADQAGGDIMAWICEGAKRFIEGGKKLPKVIVGETITRWKTADEWLWDFLDDKCEIDPMQDILLSVLFEAYENYCRARFEKPRKRKELETALAGVVDQDGRHIFRIDADSHTKLKSVIGLNIEAHPSPQRN